MDRLVDEISEGVIDRLCVDEVHGFLVACLTEKALAGSEHVRKPALRVIGW